MTLSIAFKEWAVICRALSEGRQSLILRKGGIAEIGGEFRPEHDRFLLYPTYFHEQHHTGIKPALLPLLDAVECEKPAAGRISFTHFAAVSKVWHIDNLDQALALDELHIWTAEEVAKRFRYRTPGLYAFAVRIYQLKEATLIVEKSEYAGCKTWVGLDAGIATDGATPVVSDAAHDEFLERIERLPT